MSDLSLMPMTKRYRAYSSYKDSRVQWIKKIPESWSVKRLKSIAVLKVSNVDKKTIDGQYPVKLCNYVDVYYNENIDSTIEFMDATATIQQILKFQLMLEDVLITKDSESPDDIAVSSVVVENLPGVICGYHLALIRPKKEIIIGKFLAKAFGSIGFKEQFQVVASGITRFGLSIDAINTGIFPVPPLQEQRAIIAFLENKCAKIDMLVQKKESIITLLREKRSALIARAITNGLDPKVKMKNSGVEWLGDIPQKWKVERSKRVFNERDDRSETGKEELMSVSHLTGVTPRSEKDVNMFEAKTTEGYKICYPDDLVINTLWAWMGAMGVSPMHGIVSPAYNVYSPDKEKLDPKYVDYLVRMPVFAQEVTRFSNGVWSSRLRLYPEGFFEIRIPVPPLDEQRAIVSHLKQETGKIDALIAKVQQGIDRFEEYRSALISAAVTGKIDVREESLN